MKWKNVNDCACVCVGFILGYEDMNECKYKRLQGWIRMQGQALKFSGGFGFFLTS